MVVHPRSPRVAFLRILLFPATASIMSKQPISIYTMMIILANIFMLLACIFMAIEYFGRWGGPSSPKAPNVQWTHQLSDSNYV